MTNDVGKRYEQCKHRGDQRWNGRWLGDALGSIEGEAAVAILQLTGTSAQFEQLLAIPGFYLDHHTVTDLGGGRFTISTFMDESSIPDIEGLGLTVEIEVTDAEFAAHMASFHDDSPPIV